LVSRRYNKAMDTPETHDLLERLSNLLRMETRAFGLKYGLQPVQVEALKYLTECNRYSDTPQAVGDYLGLTKGTVSQSLKVLEQKGLLTKRHDKEDKRLLHLTPTHKGKNLIKKATQGKHLALALTAAQSATSTDLAQVLQTVLRTLQQANGRKPFGACHSCRFHERGPQGSVCGLTQEPLSLEDSQRLCREHEYPDEPQGVEHS
jgi:DNA-binding MarR family transcriptional regulator